MFKLPIALTWFDICTTAWSEPDSSGLQRLPPSVTCCARLFSLRQLSHRNICAYIDIVRRKPERILIVSEAYSSSLADLPTPVKDPSWILERFSECMSALNYLDEKHIVQAYLCPKNLLLDFHGAIKFAGFGLYYATQCGSMVKFPLLESSAYSAPEVFLEYFSKNCSLTSGPTTDSSLTIFSDMWSIGLIFFELIYGRQKSRLLHKHTVPASAVNGPYHSNTFHNAQLLLEGLRLSQTSDCSLPEFLNAELTPLDDEYIELIWNLCHQSLNFKPHLRPSPNFCLTTVSNTFSRSPSENMKHQAFLPCLEANDQIPKPPIFPSPIAHTPTANNSTKAVEFLSNLSDLCELYYYWRLTGGNLDAVLQSSLIYGDSSSCITSKDHYSFLESSAEPPVARLPHYLAIQRASAGESTVLTDHWPKVGAWRHCGYNSTPTFLPCERLLDRIERVPLPFLYPRLLTLSPAPHGGELESCDWSNPSSIAKLLVSLHPQQANSLELQSIGIKQMNVDYQIQRIGLFKRLLNGLPVTESRLRIEARKDIPPFLRKQIWTALLGLHKDNDYRRRYIASLAALGEKAFFYPRARSTCDSAEDDPLDGKLLNQISVDLPRCHAYDSLLASPSGQSSLFQVLLTALSSQGHKLEYTQGMDSVAAVFVRLCYPDNALASACLRSFLVSKLSNFFGSGGFTLGLRAFFNVLIRLFAFHIPRLAVYLTDLGVPLVGLTTGWIYTFFAHTMPLDRTEIIWDTLIVGPLSLVMFFYIAVFLQLDQQLNLQAICLEKICTILSNFPDIDMDRCRSDALCYALSTPFSLTVEPGTDSASTTKFTDSLSVNPKSRGSLFYERLCQPGSWPLHLEVDRNTQGENQLNLTCSEQQCSNSPLDNIPLVSYIDPTDALEHFARPDCFVLDCRHSFHFNKCCIVGSVNRSPAELPFNNSDSTSDESLNYESKSSSPTMENDWEFVDYQAGSKRAPCVMHPFLLQLTAEPAWISSVQARIKALSLSGVKSAASLVTSPGLVVIVGGSETLGHSTDTPAIRLADWLIRMEVDRVCVLHGGFPAFRNLGQSSRFIFCPTAR